MKLQKYYEQAMKEKTSLLVEAAKLLGIVTINQGKFELVWHPNEISQMDERNARDVLNRLINSNKITLLEKRLYFPERELHEIQKLADILSTNIRAFSQKELRMCLLNNPALSSYLFWYNDNL